MINMTGELDILKIVAENPGVSQRKIAEQTGISLGQVNFLIKKCAKKGLIKIEGQTSKSIKYNLTPKGLSEKAAKTLQYLKISYGAVIALTDKIRSLAEKFKSEGYEIYVYGSNDEMMEIIKLAIDGKAKYLNNDGNTGNTIDNSQFGNERIVIFCWEEEKRADLKDLYAVNILE